MDVIYSIGSRFGESGIGYSTYQFIRHIYARSFLKNIFVTSYSVTEIDAELFITCSYIDRLSCILRIPNRLVPLSKWYLFKDTIFDRWVSSNLGECDIFHGWTNQSLSSIKVAKKRGSTTFLEHPTAHVLTQERLLRKEYFRWGIKAKPIEPRVVEKKLQEYQAADFVIVPSTFAYDSFLEEGVDKKKLILLPYGVDVERFKPEPIPARDNIFRIIFVGQIGLRKGIGYLLKAWSQLKLKNAELIMAGWVHPDTVGVLKEYNNCPGIKITEFIVNPEELYNSASICVFPSVEDGFGMVVLEAMACRRPVIITENTGAKDVITDGEDGFIIPASNIEVLKEKILYFYENREEIEKMGGAAERKAHLHIWQESADKLLSTYKSALGKVVIK